MKRWILVLLLVAGPAFATPLKPFSYHDVVLTDGPLATQAARARQFFLDVDEDSLLQGFRLRAGLPAPGQPMGGWYDPDDFAAAHPFGQFISALSRMYANTSDPRFKAKVARLVHGFHETLRPDGYFYASAKVASEWPCYLYDKNCTGMRDAYTLTGNREALEVLGKMTDWAVANLPSRADEWYTLQENLYNCYALTGEKRYLDLVPRYEYHDFWDPLADGVNAFTPERHAYSHVNSLCSAARAYEATGNDKYLHCIENAWQFLTGTQMYASGGWGPNEHWIVPGHGNLAACLSTTDAHFETPCGSYANVNLDRYLLRFTGQSRYGDNMERVLYNGMLTVLPMQSDGRTFYYSDYKPGTHKHYFDSAWPCCAGTYAEITADYPTDIYFSNDKGLYVNLFTSSRVQWRGATIVQTTDYPLSNVVQFTVQGGRPFVLHVRVPSWAAGHVPAEYRSYPCRDGARIRIQIPMALRFEPIDAQTPDRVALMYGPILLVATASDDVHLHGDTAHPATWIWPLRDGRLSFRTADGNTTFRPLYQLIDEAYTTYCEVTR